MNTKSPVLWITVARRYDRSHLFGNNNLGRFPSVRFVRVNGVDPIWHSIGSTGNALTHGHAACWLSHYNAWQVGLAIIETTGCPGCTFLEDDVILSDDFAEHLVEIESGKFGENMVRLDPTAPSSSGAYGYWMPVNTLRKCVDTLLVRSKHIDFELLQSVPVCQYPKRLVKELSSHILSETCQFTWEQIHKRPA